MTRDTLRALLAAAHDAEPNGAGARAISNLRDAAANALPGLLDDLAWLREREAEHAR